MIAFLTCNNTATDLVKREGRNNNTAALYNKPRY